MNELLAIEKLRTLDIMKKYIPVENKSSAKKI